MSDSNLQLSPKDQQKTLNTIAEELAIHFDQRHPLSIVQSCHWISPLLKRYLSKVEYYAKTPVDGETIYWMDKIDRLSREATARRINLNGDVGNELYNLFNQISSKDLEAMANCTSRTTPWGHHIHDVITMRILLEKS